MATNQADGEYLPAVQRQATDMEFVHPDSLQSRLSPAAYLAELYRLTGGKEGRLQQRRPDLAFLPLTESTMHEEVSTLALANQALAASIIQKESGLTDLEGLERALNSPQTSLLSLFQRHDQFIQLALRAHGISYQQVNVTLGAPSKLMLRPAPIAVLRLNAVEQVYFWNDTSHSCYRLADKTFYTDQLDYDAQGRRLNKKISGWPQDKTLAAAFRNGASSERALMLFWSDNTCSEVTCNANAQLVSVTAPVPISNVWPGYPTGKALVAVGMPDESLRLFFWQDGTHSGYSQIFKKSIDGYDADGYRPNSYYGLPMTKTVSATEYMGTAGSLQVFWDDGTHSELRNYALVKDREGYDKDGYRANEEIPNWKIDTNSPRFELGLSPLQWNILSARRLLALATPVAELNLTASETLYFWPDNTHSLYSKTENTWYRARNGFDAQGRRRNDTLTGWPAGKTLAAATFRPYHHNVWLLWADHTSSVGIIENSGGELTNAGPNSAMTEYPTGGKRLVATLLITRQYTLFFWHDNSHALYAHEVEGTSWRFLKGELGVDESGYRPNSHYGLPMTKTVSAAESLGQDNHFRVFWHDGTHSQIEGGLVTNRDGFDAQGYRSNSALPAWPWHAATVQPPRPSQQGMPPSVVAACLPPEPPTPSRCWPLTETLSDTSGELTLRTLSRHTAEPTFVPSLNAEHPVLHLTGQTLFCLDTLFKATPCALTLRWRTDHPGELLSLKQISMNADAFALLVDEQALTLLLCGQTELALPFPPHDPDDVRWHQLQLNIDTDSVQLSVDGQCPVTMPYPLTLGGQQLLSLGSGEWHGELADLQLFDCLLPPADAAALSTPSTSQPEHDHHA
ncbi:Tc toxin subunit A [Aeromonas sp. S12(2024)]|uniref:Tc toxin subunit A n=1 Tax=Aeromonas sp. S12(2024) TaxID=3242885 RepID=UPI00352903DD